MRLELLDIGDADQLSACKLSLKLGVFTDENKLDGFLRFARGMVNAERAILAFHDEPYVWYSSADGFKAFCAKKEANLVRYFDEGTVLDTQHKNYQAFSKHIHDLGVGHSRIIAFNLKKKNSNSVGQVILFDDQSTSFNHENIDLVHEFALSLINILELRVDYAALKEHYEEQLALNFSKTKFFQVIAHDLRAPFHGLIGFSDVLAHERDTLEESDVQGIANYLHDTLQSTYTLLENLLNWAMAEGGRFVYHPINYKLKQTAKIVEEVLSPLAARKNIQLIENVPEDIAVFADMNMVTSIIQNLVSNALKFTQTDGSGVVSISAKQLGQYIKIVIQDNGLGMTKLQSEHVFEPQIKPSVQGTIGEKGTGLGLVLCKRFVDLNHGEISVKSENGVGTTFILLLPASNGIHQVLPIHRVEKLKTELDDKIEVQ